MLKRLLFYLVLAVLGTYALNKVYECFLRPDSLFFQKTIEISKKWSYELRKSHEPCYVFTGGSEVRMNIEPQTMLEKQGVRAINAGAQAGNGVRCNAQIALPFLRKGDTLLVSYIPGNDTFYHDGMSQVGINFCHTMQGFSPFTSGIIPTSCYSIASLFRGSSSTYAIHIMRLLTRPDCIYRYSSLKNAEISKTGRVNVFLSTVQQAGLSDEPVEFKPPVMHSWESFMNDLKRYCHERGITLVMYISRAYISINHRKNNAAAALFFIKEGFPVLKDPYLGCWPDASMFSDTDLHLSIEGGKIFSEFLALQLKNQQYWSKEELQQVMGEPLTAGEH